MNMLNSIFAERPATWRADGCGVTRRDTTIESFVHIDAYADESARHRVLLIGGLAGGDGDMDAIAEAARDYAASQRVRNRIALSVAPCANPDGFELGVAPLNGSGGSLASGFPPSDGFFHHAESPEARYLWRYIGFMAPDLIVEARAGDSVAWEFAGDGASALAASLGASAMPDDGGLLSALSAGTPNDLGTIPGLRLTAPAGEIAAQTRRLWATLDRRGVAPSPAREELARRRKRAPIEVAAPLAERYGNTLSPVIYTQGVALSGRLRYGELTGARDDYAARVAAVVEPYASGARAWFADGDAGANHAGLVWCDELSAASGDARYANLLVSIADLYTANEPGAPPPPCDPDYRTEDFFFAGAILGRAFALTGERKYADTQAAFLMNAAIQQDDGLFWHCRSVPHYWGRGNGFAALGFAETLAYLPTDHPDRPALVEAHTRHLSALAGLRRPSGMLSQLLDERGSYQELTATCMTGYAVARGVRLGWLDESWRELAEGLWRAASERIGMDGDVVDGCTGTGAVDDRRFYLDRAAEYGTDERTGNLALWHAVEMERLRREFA